MCRWGWGHTSINEQNELSPPIVEGKQLVIVYVFARHECEGVVRTPDIQTTETNMLAELCLLV